MDLIEAVRDLRAELGESPQETVDLVDSVRDLRAKLCESQQEFATRLGISIRTVAHYEKDRTPDARGLAQMALAAEEIRCFDLSADFWIELEKILGLEGRLALLPPASP